MYTQTDIDAIQDAIGWGDVIEGTPEYSIVIINDLVLSQTVFREVKTELEDGETKMEVVAISNNLTLVSEIERVEVMGNWKPRFKLYLKSGAEVFFDVAENADVNDIISTILLHIGNNKNNKK